MKKYKDNARYQIGSEQKGFTLLELLIVIAIIGVLATIAVPRFQQYSEKAKFVEVVNATSPYKTAVEVCLMEYAAADCDAGSNGIPEGFSTAQGRVASLTVVDGKITATGDANTFSAVSASGEANTVSAVTYELTPTVNANSITWGIGGTCTTAGLCN